jgi:hypothetical protein
VTTDGSIRPVSFLLILNHEALWLDLPGSTPSQSVIWKKNKILTCHERNTRSSSGTWLLWWLWPKLAFILAAISFHYLEWLCPHMIDPAKSSTIMYLSSCSLLGFSIQSLFFYIYSIYWSFPWVFYKLMIRFESHLVVMKWICNWCCGDPTAKSYITAFLVAMDLPATKSLDFPTNWAKPISGLLVVNVWSAFSLTPQKFICHEEFHFSNSSMYSATHVFSTTPSLQNRKRCAGGMIRGQECPYSSNYTFLDSTDLVEYKNICLDFLACLKKKFEIFEVMHLEHPPIYPIICSYVYP